MNQTSPLANIRIVLVQTYHPGNIGAVARAMKTMGLKDLVLVNPREYPHEESTRRAVGAVDVLDDADQVFSLEDAIADRTQVFAASSRKKYRFARPQKNCEEAVDWIKQHPDEKIAIVFGAERDGLTSEDISLCQQILTIPGNPEYDTLNIAAAVQIVSYELFRQLHPLPALDQPQRSHFATQDEINQFFTHLTNSLEETGYIKADQPSETLPRLRELFNRAEPSARELAMLRGMVESITRK